MNPLSHQLGSNGKCLFWEETEKGNKDGKFVSDKPDCKINGNFESINAPQMKHAETHNILRTWQVAVQGKNVL